MSILREITTTPNDNILDAFSNMRIAPPTFVADGQFTYDLQPLLYEQVVSGSGATITHDATNRAALFTFSSTPTGGSAFLQSYDWHRYQTGRGQEVIISVFNMEAATNVVKFARLGTTSNGYAFEVTSAGKFFKIYSDTASGDLSAEQTDWNIDKLNGFGKSGITLDVSKANILYLDFQALYAGRVRFGFDINGIVYWCHEFDNANVLASPYIQNANLPIQVGMTCTGTATATFRFTCSCVLSRGGQEKVGGYSFVKEGTVTAGNNTRTHLLSIRPKALFNTFPNRTQFVLDGIEMLVTGNSPVLWELCIGDVITGTTTFADVNATYSAVEFNTAGTTSGSPTVVAESGYCPATNTVKGVSERSIPNRFPITLDAAGVARSLGTLTLLVTGIGGTSACRGIMKWRELR